MGCATGVRAAPHPAPPGRGPCGRGPYHPPMAPPGVTRLAPSPTGPLHLGNACTFLATWALARNQRWRIEMRMEDLDAPRVQAAGDAAAAILEELRWLGVEWDGPVLTQSAHLEVFAAAVTRLAEAGLVYESPHSRADVRQAASAPHADDVAAAFPASLRAPPGPRWRFESREVNHRMVVHPGGMEIVDGLQGSRVLDPAREFGDVVVWTRGGVPAYQLAVVVDDGRTGVTDVVRGADLLPSAAVQTLIHRALSQPVPRWWHVPLVVDQEGRRLAKRRGDATLSSLRSAGVPRERVLGLVAGWILGRPPEPIEPEAFVGAVDLPALRQWALRAHHPGHAPRFDAAAQAWLHG